MNTKKIAIFAATVAGSCLSWNASAQTFAYNAGDLLLGFRSSGSSSNVVVDIGAASTYLNATSAFTVSAFTAGQVTGTLGSLNNLYFSVFGDINNNSSAQPLNTLWLTIPRADAATQTDPLHSKSTTSQGTTRSFVDGIANGAQATTLGAVALSATVTVEPGSMNSSGNLSYNQGIASPLNNTIGNVHGTWSNIEQLTPAGFDAGSTSLVLDLYQYNPGTANLGQYLGNFSLNPAGALLFTPVAVPEPTTWAMFGSGLIAFAAARRFGLKKQTSIHHEI